LRVQFDDLQARLVAVRLGVVIPERQGRLRGHGTLVPEPLGSFVVDAFAELIDNWLRVLDTTERS